MPLSLNWIWGKLNCNSQQIEPGYMLLHRLPHQRHCAACKTNNQNLSSSKQLKEERSTKTVWCLMFSEESAETKPVSPKVFEDIRQRLRELLHGRVREPERSNVIFSNWHTIHLQTVALLWLKYKHKHDEKKTHRIGDENINNKKIVYWRSRQSFSSLVLSRCFDVTNGQMSDNFMHVFMVEQGIIAGFVYSGGEHTQNAHISLDTCRWVNGTTKTSNWHVAWMDLLKKQNTNQYSHFHIYL